MCSMYISVIDADAYAEHGLCNGRVSVRPSVCPIDRQLQRRAVGLLLSALRAGDINR